MIIQTSQYIKSVPTVEQGPNNSHFSEFAFIGRSNVGKSSLVNYLANKKKLAYVSNQPGKTTYFNYYLMNNNHYWVDSPGYGFAKVAKKKRHMWQKAWKNFVQKNAHLLHTFQLIDARIPLQKIDLEMMKDLLLQKIEWSIIFTKSEKMKTFQIDQLIERIHNNLETGETQINCFVTSATNKLGGQDILDFIEKKTNYS